MKRFMFLLLACLFMASCSTFHDAPNTSVWAGQLWLAFWLPFLGSLYLFYLSYRASRSGSERLPNSSGEPAYQSDENIPMHKTGGKFWFAVVLQLLAWGVVVYVNSGFWR